MVFIKNIEFLNMILTKFCIILIALILACNANKVPDNVIERNKMVLVLVDMHLADAVLAKVNNPDTMLMMSSSKYYLIFKRHSIDSAMFTRSLKYYNTQPIELKKMYVEVIDSLNAKITLPNKGYKKLKNLKVKKFT